MSFDYTDYLKRQKEKENLFKEEPRHRKFSLASLRNFWEDCNSKTKREILILIGTVILIILVLLYYFSSVSTSEVLPPPPPAE